MNTPELQRLKMAWLAAREAGDTQAQLHLLHDYPGEQAALIDFIAAYHATGGAKALADVQEAPLLPLTQRAMQAAMQRVFASSSHAHAANLAELRKVRNLGKQEVAKGLRVSVDVWSKFESGAIELASLSQRQLDRLARFFQISVEQFSSLLNASQPSIGINRRQTREAARSEQQAPRIQTFAEAIARSSMSQEDKAFWLDPQ